MYRALKALIVIVVAFLGALITCALPRAGVMRRMVLLVITMVCGCLVVAAPNAAASATARVNTTSGADLRVRGAPDDRFVGRGPPERRRKSSDKLLCHW